MVTMKTSSILVGFLLMLLCTPACDRRRTGRPRLGEVERLPRLETVVLGKPARLEMVRSYTAYGGGLRKGRAVHSGQGLRQGPCPDIDIGRVVKMDEILLTLDVPDLIADQGSKAALVDQKRKGRGPGGADRGSGGRGNQGSAGPGAALRRGRGLSQACSTRALPSWPRETP